MTEEQRTEQGVVFPLVGGRRSTAATARGVFADAARAVDGGLASAIDAERDWRKGYVRHLRALVEAEARSTKDALRIAADGLASAHERFEFARDGATMPLARAMAELTEPRLHTATVTGRGERAAELAVPYRGRELRGDDLLRQLDDWTARGVCEPSFAETVRRVVAHPEWLDLSGVQVALLGAGAEMGPLRALCAWGADVLAVDLPREQVWRRIVDAAVAGCGRLHVPVHEPTGDDPDAVVRGAGADLLAEAPEVRTWLDGFAGPLTVGNYAYADGATFARLAMAVDAVTLDLVRRRRDASVAYLATPTDVFAVPVAAVEDSRTRYARQGWPGALQRPLRVVTGGRLFSSSYPDVLETEDGPVGVNDCLVVQQGPNYAMAKRLQRWRATTSRQDGVRTSAHVAPPTRTRSVVKNRILAAAYAGAPRFGVEIFEPATSNTLMAAVLVHDLREPSAAASPGITLRHPHDLFMEAANHGGLWREPFAPRTALPVAAVLGLLGLGKR